MRLRDEKKKDILNKGKILHIATDEKWVSKAYSIFELAFKEWNEVIILSENDTLKYVGEIPNTILKQSEINASKLNEIFHDVQVVVLHSIDIAFYKIKFPNHVKVIWVGFGFDYYDFIYKNDDELLLPITKTLRYKTSKKNTFNEITKSIRNGRLNSKLKGRLTKKEYIKTIDYFVPVLSSEYEILKKNYDGKLPQLEDWNYGTLEDDYTIEAVNNERNNILLGNSATYTNNHMEILDIIKDVNIAEHSKIICPLSYGDIEYAQYIKKHGCDLFGNKFEPLMDFLTKVHYINVLSSCTVAIFNHIRQQAMGNIIIMLYLGAKVYVRRENPAYTFFIKKGIKVFLVEDITNEKIIINDLSALDIDNNKMLLESMYSQNVMLEKTKSMISNVLS